MGFRIKTKCECNREAIALEHDLDCPIKVGFFGGNPRWNQDKRHITMNAEGDYILWTLEFHTTWRPQFLECLGRINALLRHPDIEYHQ